MFEIFYIFTQLIESVKIQIGIEIAQGLDYMHTRDPAVIHQDIKPENIVVSILPVCTMYLIEICVRRLSPIRVMHAYICDLGIAKLHNVLASQCTTRGQGAGTPIYKAPEMFICAKQSTPVHIYSFGCLLIELFGRKRVWENVDLIQLTAAINGSQTPSTEHKPLVYQDICTKCTAHAASDRPTCSS